MRKNMVRFLATMTALTMLTCFGSVAFAESTSTATIGKASTTGTESTVTVTVTPTVSKGVVTATLSSTVIHSAFSAAVLESATQGTQPNVILNITTASDVSESEITIPDTALQSISDSDKTVTLTLVTSNGSLSLDQDAISAICKQSVGSEDVFTFTQVSTDALTSAQQAAVGTGSVFEVSIQSSYVSFSQVSAGTTTVSLPYSLNTGESAAGLTVWDLGDDGTLTQISGSYNTTAGTMTFSTSSISTYVILAGADPSTPTGQTSYSDVSSSAWYYDAVQYAVENGLMNGTGDATFSPLASLNRAMLVTVLYRLAGEPAITGSDSFSDVTADSWYGDAVSWASENAIVLGIGDSSFQPDGSITREQIATILYRYAQSSGYDVSKADDLASFSDAAKVSSYAETAVKWAVAQGILNGSNGALNPTGTATRAEAAAMLQRFAEKIAN